MCLASLRAAVVLAVLAALTACHSDPQRRVAALLSILDSHDCGYWACSRCVTSQELERQLERTRSNPRVLVANAAQEPHVDRSGTVRVRATFPGGHFEAIGHPERSAHQVVLSFRPVRPLGPSPCAAELFRDGTELQVHELQRRSDHEVLAAIDVDALHGLERSIRFALHACERELELDRDSRESLSRFAARFAERRFSQASAQEVSARTAGEVRRTPTPESR